MINGEYPVPPLNAPGKVLPAQAPVGEVHNGHGTNTAPNGSSGPTFAAALAQAVGSPSVGSPHVGHGVASGGNGQGGGAHIAQHGSAANMPFTPGHPSHIPLGSSQHRGGHAFQELALGLRAYRQQLIASNIANADTPGYKAVDIDFREAIRLAQSLSQTPSVALKTTSAGHIVDSAPQAQAPFPLKYEMSRQGSVDGNTVDMDVERAKFSENAVMYEFSLDRVGGHFKHMMELFQLIKG